MPDFLLEVGCEEIPARMIEGASRDLRERLGALLDSLATQIERWANVAAIGYTHLQPAEPTTVGYRLAQTLQDVLMDVQALRLAGSSYERAGDEDLNQWRDRLNTVWRNMASPHWALIRFSHSSNAAVALSAAARTRRFSASHLNTDQSWPSTKSARASSTAVSFCIL